MYRLRVLPHSCNRGIRLGECGLLLLLRNVFLITQLAPLRAAWLHKLVCISQRAHVSSAIQFQKGLSRPQFQRCTAQKSYVRLPWGRPAGPMGSGVRFARATSIGWSMAGGSSAISAVAEAIRPPSRPEFSCRPPNSRSSLGSWISI